MVAPYPQPVAWTLESVWELEERFAPLRVARTITDSAGAELRSLRHDFDWNRGTVRFTNIDQSGRKTERSLQVPPDTITGDGLALWLRAAPFESPRPVGFHLLSDEPNLYRVTATIGDRETTQTAAGLFEAHRVHLDFDLGLLNIAKILVPKTFLWFSAEYPFFWVRSETLENGYGTRKVYRELLSTGERE
jgi:hypothetical protein